MLDKELCRLCLSEEKEKALFQLDLEMSILEMGSGQKVTIGDALKYIGLDILIPPIEQSENDEERLDDEQDEEKKVKAENESIDHPDLPKTLCQECLDKLQLVYEFKFRCEENREYLRNYLKDQAEAKEIETEAARQVAMAELDIDLNNLDSLPDKLVLKPVAKKQRKPRRRDPANPPKKRRMPDKSIIIAEDSQVETAIYVRKVVTTPEKSPEQKHSSKRKSKHVIIEDIPIAEKPKAPKYDRYTRKKEPLFDENNKNESNSEQEQVKEEPTSSQSVIREIRDEEPIFEDDEETNKRPRRSRK